MGARTGARGGENRTEKGGKEERTEKQPLP